MIFQSGLYVWTHHARDKMKYYRLTEARIKRIIRHPSRVEEGIFQDAIACMQPAEGRKYSEIWTLYVLQENTLRQAQGGQKKNIKIITAWRYPGKSPARDPIPAEVLREIKKIIF